MIYLQGYTVSFQEVPDEVSLVFLIGDCPHHCPGCHSPQMWKAEGQDLNAVIDNAIAQYEDAITCVCFMGEGQDYPALFAAMKKVKQHGFKVCLYTGYYFDQLVHQLRSEDPALLNNLSLIDYVKEGPYIKRYGGLNCKTTNQRMMSLIYIDEHTWKLTDLTKWFQKKV